VCFLLARHLRERDLRVQRLGRGFTLVLLTGRGLAGTAGAGAVGVATVDGLGATTGTGAGTGRAGKTRVTVRLADRLPARSIAVARNS